MEEALEKEIWPGLVERESGRTIICRASSPSLSVSRLCSLPIPIPGQDATNCYYDVLEKFEGPLGSSGRIWDRVSRVSCCRVVNGHFREGFGSYA